MDFDSNCYRASLISFSVLHFLSVGGLLTLTVLRGLDSYFINDLVPEQYTPVMYALTTGTILSIVASKEMLNSQIVSLLNQVLLDGLPRA